MLFSVTVFPPVFGPVIATTRKLDDTSTLIGTTVGPPAFFCCQISKGWRSSRNRNDASGLSFN